MGATELCQEAFDRRQSAEHDGRAFRALHLYMPPPDSGTGKKKRGKKATGTLIPEESEG